MKNQICSLVLVIFALSCARARQVATPDPGPTCPYPSTEIIYFPYEGDCTKYWECYSGHSYLYTCPAGLWWHQEISECDYPGDFCTDGTTQTDWTETTDSTPTIGPTTTNGDLPDCTGTGDDPVYYPYPGDCTKYYECANGRLYTYNCPPDLWWHQEISECDYPGDFCVPDTRGRN
ncbi:peritrophic matrix protein 2-B precursor [Tribolium castaneum]|uniref:Peritrophic matrix protein 2-B n=1 Tax=Tribolium castaneum TaxID=7070 RepID=D1MAJ2_TRICA|nr:peritrophic matrix protein 2-B precursor [Tribolium castaneum]ACY95483.1 peritrophic matrix protein 2-B [Tribolium castaneum]EFA00424.1 hypothetical protein TcasGA2_TC003275 [Tribolium castaneum]|eukprot:NP_001161920.1 peritrophic matrix protein 2-B precursor [Tribolium castaneum]